MSLNLTFSMPILEMTSGTNSVEKRLLDVEKYWEMGVNLSNIVVNAVPLEEIRQMLNKAFASFVIRPRFLFAQAARTDSESLSNRILDPE